MAKYNITEKKEKDAAYRNLVSPQLMDELKEKILEIKVKKYRKHHGKIRSKIYKNYCEYQMEYDAIKLNNIIDFLCKKIKRRRNRLSQNL